MDPRAPEDGRRQGRCCRAPQGRSGRVRERTGPAVEELAKSNDGRRWMPAPPDGDIDGDVGQSPRGFCGLPADLPTQTGPLGDYCWLAVRRTRAVHVCGLRAPAFSVDNFVFVLSLERYRSYDLGGAEELLDGLSGS